MALFDTAPHSLCILRLSAIGDVCNTIAVVQAIQHQWPKARITWITGTLEAKLLESIDGIELVVFDKSQGWKAHQTLWSQLRGRRFDALLHMQYAFRASIATLGINAQYKLGFDSQRSQDFQTLFTNIKVPSPQKPHVLDGLMAFTHQLGIDEFEPCWKLDYNPKDAHWAEQYLVADRNNLVIVPGASKAYKNWHAQGYVDVIHHAEKLGWHVILAGSPAAVETELAKDIESLCDVPVTNIVGQSSLLQMLALLDKCELVIAPDTGPAHMANAMNTPVIGLYAHHNPQRTGPYQYLDYVVSVWQQAIEQQTGQSHTMLDWRSRVKDKQAMNLIKSEQVIQMFDHVCEKESLL
ncbi:glycosyltransferase family 9 protein [uncultured Vibrio sp.]|uniref:glycosyltransferase family 9 protein n=1 Tax=uncultured Vibrio sp. TaxID=114054 RepID=UPI0025CDCE95|nr:glycosyltransferase family 9 protein [uncultured Vibrio sp.]